LRADFLASNAEKAIAPSSPHSLHARDWENPSLDAYRKALHAWTEDMGDRSSEPPSWRAFADMLDAAKIYE
jgi:hypothetical protein